MAETTLSFQDLGLKKLEAHFLSLGALQGHVWYLTSLLERPRGQALRVHEEEKGLIQTVLHERQMGLAQPSPPIPVVFTNISVMWVKLTWILQTSSTANWIPSTDPISLYMEHKNWPSKTYDPQNWEIMIFLKLLNFGVIYQVTTDNQNRSWYLETGYFSKTKLKTFDIGFETGQWVETWTVLRSLLG